MNPSKNIHILPTDKPSRVFITKDEGLGFDNQMLGNTELDCQNQNIYITSDEEIQEGDSVIEITTSPRHPYIGKTFYPKNDGTVTEEILKRDLLSVHYKGHYETLASNCKKIILTTDEDLIKDDVQAIDDEFLEWFVNNSSCEEVKVRYSYPTIDDEGDGSISEGYWLLIFPE